ncbi:peptidase [Mesobacillus boroniphilus]|uniref:Peptidase n=1 Tax=Mesobacillus boroniphilus TaxID=308892 RepID=A0A944CKF8_9BACI|nr:peptidase [Mesobacillus boroniphilus]
MKKWIFFSILIVVTITGILVNVYLNAVEPVKAAEKEAVQIALKETNLSDFTNFSLYSGEETYYVMTGKNVKQEDVYVWINEKNSKVITRNAKKGITKKEALNKLYQEKNPNEIIEVRLGMARIQKTDRPAWEIYYRNNSDTINYYYVDFDTGEKLRAIDNL